MSQKSPSFLGRPAISTRVHDLCEGKYRVYHSNGTLTVKRNGKEWPAGDNALCGDSLSLAMIQRIEALEDRSKKVAQILATETEDMGGLVEKALNTLYGRLEV